ncbi:MAG: response regulator [Chloroflexi bacterium]|nr:response regulator [Chloroflexota bacterium]
MQTQTRATRVLLASEQPDVRQLLAGVVQREPGAFVVGQAENGVKAVALARSLRPDVVVVDSCLPHVVGLDSVPLSRIGGLDTATSISQELPAARVILLGNLSMAVYEKSGPGGDAQVRLYSQTAKIDLTVRLGELRRGTVTEGEVLFANLEVTERAPARHKAVEVAEKAAFVSGLAIMGGLGLMLTLILAQAGVLLALAGVAGLLVSLAVRTVAAMMSKAAPAEADYEVKGAKKSVKAA